MRGLTLFARTRRWPFNAATAVLGFVLVLASGPLSYAANPSSGYRMAVTAQLPLLAAVVVQASLASPLHVGETRAARGLARWRALHLSLLGLLSGGLLALGVGLFPPPDPGAVNAYAVIGPLAIVRNYLAFTGAALVCAALIGPTLGWVLPLAWAIVPYLLLPNPAADASGLLTLVAQPDDAFGPFCLAAMLWLTGLATASRLGGAWGRDA